MKPSQGLICLLSISGLQVLCLQDKEEAVAYSLYSGMGLWEQSYAGKYVFEACKTICSRFYKAILKLSLRNVHSRWHVGKKKDEIKWNHFLGQQGNTPQSGGKHGLQLKCLRLWSVTYWLYGSGRITFVLNLLVFFVFKIQIRMTMLG